MKLFGKRREEEQKTKQDEAATEIACEHITLIPSWDKAEDIGHEDRVSQYRCEACGNTFSLAEAQNLRNTESQRLQRKLAG